MAPCQTDGVQRQEIRLIGRETSGGAVALRCERSVAARALRSTYARGHGWSVAAIASSCSGAAAPRGHAGGRDRMRTHRARQPELSLSSSVLPGTCLQSTDQQRRSSKLSLRPVGSSPEDGSASARLQSKISRCAPARLPTTWRSLCALERWMADSRKPAPRRSGGSLEFSFPAARSSLTGATRCANSTFLRSSAEFAAIVVRLPSG